MDNILLAAGVLLLTVQLAGLVLAWAYIFRKLKHAESILRSFITAPNDKTPSPLAELTDQISQVAARAIISQAKMTFMGEASAVSRQEKKSQDAATLSRFPWLAAISSIAPGFSKTLLKNPGLLNLGQSILSKGNGNKPAPAPTSPGSNQSTQSSFDL